MLTTFWSSTDHLLVHSLICGTELLSKSFQNLKKFSSRQQQQLQPNRKDFDSSGRHKRLLVISNYVFLMCDVIIICIDSYRGRSRSITTSRIYPVSMVVYTNRVINRACCLRHYNLAPHPMWILQEEEVSDHYVTIASFSCCKGLTRNQRTLMMMS